MVSFDKKQIKFLNKFFQEQKELFLKEIENENFEGDKKDFDKLCSKLYNCDKFKSAKVGSKKKRKVSGFFKWMSSKNGMEKIKQENQNKELKQKDLVKFAAEKWRKMSDEEKAKFN
tara:strand:+ start:296 stop:643 length:348 start_codon:yes stop_codon:yes gene_type:complete